MQIRTSLCGATLALFAASLPGQTAPCFGINDQNTSVSFGIYGYQAAAPNRVAWQITPTAPLTVLAAQVFTGNQFTSQVGSHMTIEIFDETSAGLPGNRLAGGTWRINGPVDWQGANLDQPLVLQTGVNYWAVWTEPGWSTTPLEPGGVTIPLLFATNASNWGSPAPAPVKFRMFCSLLDGRGAAPSGTACASAAGSLGTMFANQEPAVGNSAFRMEGSGFPSGALALLILGVNPQFPSVPVPGTPGCWLNTDPTITNAGVIGTGNVRAATAAGHFFFQLPLPNNPALTGFYFASQLAAIDPASTAALPFVTSNAMQFTMF